MATSQYIGDLHNNIGYMYRLDALNPIICACLRPDGICYNYAEIGRHTPRGPVIVVPPFIVPSVNLKVPLCKARKRCAGIGLCVHVRKIHTVKRQFHFSIRSDEVPIANPCDQSRRIWGVDVCTVWYRQTSVNTHAWKRRPIGRNPVNSDCGCVTSYYDGRCIVGDHPTSELYIGIPDSLRDFL